MPRRPSVEEALSRLRAIRDPYTAEARTELLDALRTGQSVVVQRACSIIGDAELQDFDAPLKAAFERLLDGGAEADAGCGGKVAIVQTLARRGIAADDIFLVAAHHVQNEYSGDTGAHLRAHGIVALAENRYKRVLEEAAELLFDGQPGARQGAVRALIAEGSRAATMMLRMKARLGDRDQEITLECLTGLLERDRDSLEFVASFLKTGPTAAAAMALADSRRPEAFAYLRDAIDGASEADCQAILLAMAMLRTDESLDFLFADLTHRDMGRAVLAYDALQIYASDEEVMTRLAKALRGNKYRKLLEGPRRAWRETEGDD